MKKRKHFTFNATIEKRDQTKEDKMSYDKAMDIYLDHILSVIKNKESNEKLAK